MNNILVLNSINKRFGDIKVLMDINASITKGTITAFIGPNGAGKTTLFHTIAGTIKPDSGTVIYNGNKISGLSPSAVARLGIGRQFQDVRLFGNLTVLENIIVGMISHKNRDFWRVYFHSRQIKNEINENKKNAMKWIDYVGLADFKSTFAHDLSFGQQRLLSMARLFAKGYNFLLLDEPTAGLSMSMVNKIMDLIQDVVRKKNMSVALIEHNISVVSELASHIYFLNEGKVAFSGKANDILSNRSVREMYMGL